MTTAQRIADIVVALADARNAATDGARVDLDGLIVVVEEAMSGARTESPCGRTPISRPCSGP